MTRAVYAARRVASGTSITETVPWSSSPAYWPLFIGLTFGPRGLACPMRPLPLSTKSLRPV
jgi:hypothetical protein